MKDINLNSSMNLYLCKECNIVHSKGSKIQKEHSKFRIKDLVKRYYCKYCQTFHNIRTMIHLKHYDYRNKKELTSSELYLICFRKSLNNDSKRQKKLPKKQEYINPNKRSLTTKFGMNSLYGKFSKNPNKNKIKIVKKEKLIKEMIKNKKNIQFAISLDFLEFLNKINIFLEKDINFFQMFSKYSELERKFKEIWQNKYITNFGKFEMIKTYLECLTI